MITGAEALQPKLEALLGASAVRTLTPGAAGAEGPAATAGRQWIVDGVVPRLVARPADADQTAALLRLCAEVRAAVVPWGRGAHMEVGNPPRAVDVILSTERLARVVDHDHANLTVTVEAGVPLAALTPILAERGQWLPLEPPGAEAASVGGTAAANLSGPRRAAFGTARDVVIGVRAALTNGEVIKWGGKTIKNVAGYDMAKLFVGSLGTLGVITELTLKVYPLPEVRRTIAAWGKSLGEVSSLATKVVASPLLPTAVTIVHHAAGATGPGVLVQVEGIQAAVDRHERDIKSWAAEAGLEAEALPGDKAEELWQKVRDVGWGKGEAAARLSVKSGNVPGVLAALETALPAGAGIVAHVPSGTIWIAAAPNELARVLAPLRDLAQQHAGHLLLARAPRDLKAAGDVWFPAPASAALSLMRGLKQAFDPHGILNPGRFVAGL